MHASEAPLSVSLPVFAQFPVDRRPGRFDALVGQLLAGGGSLQGTLASTAVHAHACLGWLTQATQTQLGRSHVSQLVGACAKRIQADCCALDESNGLTQTVRPLPSFADICICSSSSGSGPNASNTSNAVDDVGGLIAFALSNTQFLLLSLLPRIIHDARLSLTDIECALAEYPQVLPSIMLATVLYPATYVFFFFFLLHTNIGFWI